MAYTALMAACPKDCDEDEAGPAGEEGTPKCQDGQKEFGVKVRRRRDPPPPPPSDAPLRRGAAG